MGQEESIETRVSPAVVWQAWDRFRSGEKGRAAGFKYRVLDVDPGKSFSILWKTLFVRLVFTHKVEPIQRGSRISYQIQIKGLFAWPVRFLIGKKIQRSVAALLKSFVKQLEG